MVVESLSASSGRRLIVLCGPAACGKSTFAQRHFRPTQIVSSDWARALICDDERDQRFNTQAFALVHFLLEQRLTLESAVCGGLHGADCPGAQGSARSGQEVPSSDHSHPFQRAAGNLRGARRKARAFRGQGDCRASISGSPGSHPGTIRQEGFDQVVELQDGDLDKVQIEILFRPVQRPLRSMPAPRRPERVERPGHAPGAAPMDAAIPCTCPESAGSATRGIPPARRDLRSSFGAEAGSPAAR